MASARWVALGALGILLAFSVPAAAQTNLDNIVDDSCIDERTGEVDAGSVAARADVTAESTTATDLDSDTSFDEDTVLLSIALANNGFSGFGIDDVRSWNRDANAHLEARQAVDLDRDDVLNAVVLGESYDDVTLDCIADVETVVDVRTSEAQTVGLDEDDVLLGIALDSGSGGGLGAVGDFSARQSSSMSWSRSVDLDRDDVFAALVLGGAR